VAEKFFLDKRPHNGFTYGEFIGNTILKMNNPANFPDETKFNYTKLNLHRSQRIKKVYQPDPALEILITRISRPMIWMALTEDWCGDSAQNLPYIDIMVSLNKIIDFRILERDKNLDIIDLYLTNGKSRSIPKLVAFDLGGNELFRWGPQPKELLQLVQQWKSEGKSKDELNEALHLWYGRNRGKSLEKEFIEIISNHLLQI